MGSDFGAKKHEDGYLNKILDSQKMAKGTGEQQIFIDKWKGSKEKEGKYGINWENTRLLFQFC